MAGNKNHSVGDFDESSRVAESSRVGVAESSRVESLRDNDKCRGCPVFRILWPVSGVSTSPQIPVGKSLPLCAGRPKQRGTNPVTWIVFQIFDDLKTHDLNKHPLKTTP